MHKNSQKRVYKENGIYFITTNTVDRFPYFNEDIFCQLFVEDLEYCQRLKNFKIFAYKINPDHVHLLIQPDNKTNYSEIMRSLKTNFSRNANRIISGKFNDIPHTRSRDRAQGHEYPIPLFQWQKSFHHRLIESPEDFIVHIQYIEKQFIKHQLKENKFCFINNRLIEEMI